MVFRRLMIQVMWIALVAGAAGFVPSFRARAQDKPTTQDKPVTQEKPVKKEKSAAQDKQAAVTGEQVVELAIYFNGGREGMAQIRRTGVERGRITRAIADGKTEEATYERRFIRGESMDKDRIRLDQKMPTAEYSLVFSGGLVWGVINDVIFTPRQEMTQDFLKWQWRGIDVLLRYKENGSTITLIGKDKQKGLDLWVLDITDKEQRRTRYYISAKTARVLWLEYEERPESGGAVVKFLRKFHDYHQAQGMLVPYRTVLYKNGTQIEEMNVMTITFGPKIDDALFRNPDVPAPTTASKP